MKTQAARDVRVYIKVYLALIALLCLTVGAAYLSLGNWNWVVALGIAIAKSLLVIYFFMELRESHKTVYLFALGGFFWLALLLCITVSDYLTRGILPVPGK